MEEYHLSPPSPPPSSHSSNQKYKSSRSDDLDPSTLSKLVSERLKNASILHQARLSHLLMMPPNVTQILEDINANLSEGLNTDVRSTAETVDDDKVVGSELEVSEEKSRKSSKSSKKKSKSKVRFHQVDKSQKRLQQQQKENRIKLRIIEKELENVVSCRNSIVGCNPMNQSGNLGGYSSSSMLPEESLICSMKLNSYSNREKANPSNLILSSSNTNNSSFEFFDSMTAFGNEEIVEGHESPQSFYYNSTLKAITVLSYLCEEVSELDRIGTESIIPSILLFGPDPQEVNCDTNTTRSSRNKNKSSGDLNADTQMVDEDLISRRENELIIRMGKFMYFLQGLYNYTLRLQRLVRNLICQIAGSCSSFSYAGKFYQNYSSHFNSSDSMSEEQEHYQEQPSMLPPPLFKNVHFLPVAEALAKVLRLLITLDSSISSNSDLLEAWDLYKTKIHEENHSFNEDESHSISSSSSSSSSSSDNEEESHSDEDQSNQSNNADDVEAKAMRMLNKKEKMESFSRMIIQLDFSLMSSRCFLTAIEQNLDPGGFDATIINSADESDNDNKYNNGRNSIRVNYELHEEVKYLIYKLHDIYMERLDTNNELFERRDMVGVYGLYALHRRLVPSNYTPDSKLHKILLDGPFPQMYPLVDLVPSCSGCFQHHGSGNVDRKRNIDSLLLLPFSPYKFIIDFAPFQEGQMKTKQSTSSWLLSGGGLYSSVPSGSSHLSDTNSHSDRTNFGGSGNIDNKNNKNQNTNLGKGVSLEFIRKFDSSFVSKAKELYKSAVSWMASASSVLTLDSSQGLSGKKEPQQQQQQQQSMNNTTKEKIETMSITLLQGIIMANRISLHIRDLITFHKTTNIPIPSTFLKYARNLLQSLKGIEKIISCERLQSILFIHKAALRLIASSIYQHFDVRLRSVIDSSPFNDDEMLYDEQNKSRIGGILNASMSVLENVLKGSSSYSSLRRFTAEIASCICTDTILSLDTNNNNKNNGINNNNSSTSISWLPGGSTLKPQQQDKNDMTSNLLDQEDILQPNRQIFTSFFRRLNVLSEMDDYVKQVCDCSFLYFNKELLPAFIDDLLSSSSTTTKAGSDDTVSIIGGVQLLFSAFSDAERHLLSCAPHLVNEKPSPVLSFGEDSDDEDNDLTTLSQHNSYIQVYRTFMIEKVLKEKIVSPMCIAIETDLRLSSHYIKQQQNSDLDLTQSQGALFNPKSVTPGSISAINNLKLWKQFLDMPPLTICTKRIYIKDLMKKYLEVTFYNLTTVSFPYSSQTYTEMKFLAREKFGLDIPESHLPVSSTLDDVQGLGGGGSPGIDVLDIIRDVPNFVIKFNYNLNQQNFIERKQDRGAKFLNTVSIQSISTSIKQHGLGILSSAVNSTYKFLLAKFQEIEKFMGNEYIWSYLSKEIRWYKVRQNSNHNDIHHHQQHQLRKQYNLDTYSTSTTLGGVDDQSYYPFDRVVPFLKDTRNKLGLSTSDNHTYLDRFRILLTEIGNALGFIRMIKSARMNVCSESLQYIPYVSSSANDEDGCFNKISSYPFFSTESIEAGVGLEKIINSMKGDDEKNTNNDVDYLTLLLDVFRKVLKGPKNNDTSDDFLSPSRNNMAEKKENTTSEEEETSFDSSSGIENHHRLDQFYAIVPALSLSWMEASARAKEMMHKKNRSMDAYYTDDGFAMGTAFVLEILEQNRQFDNLNWFLSLQNKFVADAKNISERKKNANNGSNGDVNISTNNNNNGVDNNTTSTLRFRDDINSMDNVDYRGNDEYDEYEDLTTLKVTAKRLEAHKREMDMLFFSMLGSRAFFQR